MPETFDKVKQGLNCHLRPDPDCVNCPYDSIDLGCLAKLYLDFLMLMNTREAQILSLDQIKIYLAEDESDKQPLWLQWCSDAVMGGWVLSHTVLDLIWKFKDVYKVHWALWTQKPTPEQRKAVKWDA